MRVRFFCAVAIIACVPFASVRADEVVFQDGAFADADWSIFIFYNEGNGGSTQGWQSPSGGNPGSFRMVENIVNDAPPYSGIGAFHRYDPAVYDPAVSGAIESIDYREDARMFEGGGDGQAAGPAVRQAGLVYYHFLSGTPFTAWTPLSATGLTAEAFYDSPDTNNHPDFGAAAPPLEIGFYRANSTYSGGYTILGGIDNWSFTIHRDGPTPIARTSWGNVRALYR